MIYLHITFHIPVPNGPLVIGFKQREIKIFAWPPSYCFTFYKKISFPKHTFFFEHLLPYNILGPETYIKWR
jgi:hypothetical protein